MDIGNQVTGGYRKKGNYVVSNGRTTSTPTHLCPSYEGTDGGTSNQNYQSESVGSPMFQTDCV